MHSFIYNLSIYSFVQFFLHAVVYSFTCSFFYAVIHVVVYSFVNEIFIHLLMQYYFLPFFLPFFLPSILPFFLSSFLPFFHSILQLGGAASVADAKKGLSLTKEQMLEAQEMFKTSNKVTRPEKALILGFMAGSRGKSIFRCHRATASPLHRHCIAILYTMQWRCRSSRFVIELPS